MKKFLPGLVALAFAVAASAFTAPKTVQTVDDPSLHWFTPDLQTYLGERTVSAQEEMCPGEGNVCAKGYQQINEDETPVISSFDRNAEEQ